MPLKPRVKKPLPASRRIGFALVGIGKLTVNELLPALRTSKEAYVAALVTEERDKGLAFAKAFDLTENDVFTYAEYERLEAREDVEAVFVVTPNSEHLEYAQRAAAMGKHVLCEKPLCVSAASANAIVAACKEADVLLMTAYRCQHTPEHWAVRDAVQSGKLGKIKAINGIFAHNEKDAEAWRLRKAYSGGGPVVDIGIYPINIARFVLGTEPEWVFAKHHQPTDDKRFKEVEESTAIMMGFPDGILVNILTSYGTEKADSFRVMGEDATVHMEPAFAYNGLKVTFSDKNGCRTLKFPSYDQFGLEVDHFARCIKEEKQPWTPGEEGAQDHVVMDAIFESARTGAVVRLPAVAKKDAFRGSTKPKMPEQPE